MTLDPLPIQTIDSAFDQETHRKIFNFCLDADYHYGERDSKTRNPSGMVSELQPDDWVYQAMIGKILEHFPETENLSLDRAYINCFAPGENPHFHIDGKTGFTYLYYPALDWDLNEGGETQFALPELLVGVPPTPNRLVRFPASLTHRATSYRSKHRFTIAVKCSEIK